MAGVAALYLGFNPDASPEQVANVILTQSSKDKINDHTWESPNRLLYSRISQGSGQPDDSTDLPSSPSFDEDLFVGITSENQGFASLAAAANVGSRKMALCLGSHEDCLQNRGNIYYFASPESRSGRVLYTGAVQVKITANMQATLLSSTAENGGFSSYKRIQFNKK